MGLLGGYCETEEERLAIEQRDRSYMEAEQTAERIAELETQLSEIHSTDRRTTQTHEWYLDGLRYPPGEYVIMRVGPVPDDYEPTF